MGGCCSSKEDDAAEKKDSFAAGGNNDLSNGPAPASTRSCTDVWCLLVLMAAWIAYFTVTFAGISTGNIDHLYLPRDYSGAYCKSNKNWNDGTDLTDFPTLGYTMNVTSVLDPVVKQLVCSTAARTYLVEGVNPLLNESDDQYNYLCECCLIPCAKCTGSLDIGEDLTSLSDISSTISGKMSELTGGTDPSELFSPAGANGDSITQMWMEAAKYFNAVCTRDCTADFTAFDSGSVTPRSWSYQMAPDNPLASYWGVLKTSGPDEIKNTISSSFTFNAFPEALCPYPASKCIPFPGVLYEAWGHGYCSMKMASSVIDALGSEAVSTMEGVAGSELTASLGESFGEGVGDWVTSLDAFFLVFFCTFIIGFLYMVMLRFLVGFCIWFAIFMAFLSLALGGLAVYVKSFQCSGQSLFDASFQFASAAQATVAVASTTSAGVTATGETISEELEGDGANYTGVQYRTIDGYYCARWGTGTGTAAWYTSDIYPNLESNYCRNPYDPSVPVRASTIWCFTTDSTVLWQECRPVGVLQPECENGYAVDDKSLREACAICGWVIWALAIIFFLVIMCMVGKIRLAIAINRVAADFVAHNPQIILVPIVQGFIGVTWILAWAFSAAFLISQVPDDYIPTAAMTSYAEAYGTENDAGRCTGTWPSGWVYKDEEGCELAAGASYEEARCWRCAPPRYVFDYRFGISFFLFLWNNAFMIAFGQCVIAGAVGVWFFTPNDEKGTGTPIKAGVSNVLRFHMGSIAFGSCIVAMIQFIRYLLKFYEKQAKAQKNRLLVLILMIFQCFLWCFEKCVKFLNKNAYIQIALLGTNFCTSAKKAFWLILRNAIRFGSVAVLGSFIHMIGTCFIMSASIGLGYLIFTGLHSDMAPAFSLVIYGFLGYLIAKLYMNIFGMAVDTTLQCFIACEEMDLGGDFVPSALSSWLDTSEPIDRHMEDKAQQAAAEAAKDRE